MPDVEASGSSKTPGGVVVAALLLWAVLCFIAPTYLGYEGIARSITNIIGVALAVVAALGAMVELSRLSDQGETSSTVIGLTMLVPAAALVGWDHQHRFDSPWAGTLRGAVLGLVAIGGLMFLDGLGSVLTGSGRRRRSWPEMVKTIQAVFVALVGILTAVANLAKVL